jgi:hypothetical protein
MAMNVFSTEEAAEFFGFFISTRRPPVRLSKRTPDGMDRYEFKAGIHLYVAYKASGLIWVESYRSGRKQGISYYKTNFARYRIPGPFTPVFEEIYDPGRKE